MEVTIADHNDIAQIRRIDPGACADWTALGTMVRVAVTEPSALAEAVELVRCQLDELDRTCSRFRPDSELSQLRTDSHAGARVSPLLAQLIAVALRAARLTDGDVDPTVTASLIALGYDRDFSLVPEQAVNATITVVPVPGWRQVQLTRDQNGCLLTLPAGVILDLGATAKAWAADRAAGAIAAHLGVGAMVSLGGDIAIAGPAPRDGWGIRVQDRVGHPHEAPVGPTTSISLHGGAIATSSLTARRWTRGTTVLHHIIDPRTGMPATSPWRTVSVVAQRCVDANIASTAAIIRGGDAERWLQGTRLPARLVHTSGRVVTLNGFPDDDTTSD